MHPLLLVAAAFIGKGPEPLGHLVIVGGGPTTPEIAAKALAVAGGKRARVLIVPQASTRADAGQRSERMWRQAGAARVSVLDLKNPRAALTAIKVADLIWMPGGSQSRLMEALRKDGLAQAIRERFQQGATVGGTSAGAAVMSKIMFTGDTPLDSVSVDPKTSIGLGLWPEVIIDQHFVRRSRFNRLLSAVLSHPEDVGIGIDECTAIVVEGRYFEVVGKSHVIVIDARPRDKKPRKATEPQATDNVALHILRPGMRFHLDRGVLGTK
jgi:cyanophycinase